jgi:hypothetical protein
MFNTIDKDSQLKFEQSWGDVMPLNEFIECCRERSFIDYDGFAGELLLDGNIIFKSWFYPSDVLEHKQQLLDLQTELGALHVVWYNK